MSIVYPPAGMRHGYANIAKALVGAQRKSVSVLNRNHVEHFFVGSGKSALLLCLATMREFRKDKDEVIIPAYTCYSVAASVQAAGLKIRLVDIELSSLNYQAEKLKKAIGKNTLAVIFISFFSMPIQKRLIRLVSKEKNEQPFIIIDLAQSYLSDEEKYDADAYVFSLGRGKPLNTEGGGILGISGSTLKTIIAENYRKLPDPGIIPSMKYLIKSVLNDVFLQPRLYWVPARIKLLKLGVTIFPKKIHMEKMSLYQKNLLLLMQARMHEIKKHRQKHASSYRDHFKEKKQPRIPQPFFPARYPVYLNGEKIDEETKRVLKQYGVARMYPEAISHLREVRDSCVNPKDDFANSEWLARHLYTLPVHEYLSGRARDTVIRLVQPYMS